MKKWTTILGLVLGLGLAANAASYTWTNSSRNYLFHNASNWSPNGIPGVGDDVIFDNVSDQCNMQSNANVQSITFNAGFSGSLLVQKTLDVSGNVIINNGNLEVSGSGELYIFSNLTVQGGQFLAEGCLVDVGGDLYVNSGQFNLDRVDATVAGLFRHTGGNVALTKGTMTIDGSEFNVGNGFSCTNCEVALTGGDKFINFNGTRTLEDFTIELNHLAWASFTGTDVINVSGTLSLNDGRGKNNHNLTAAKIIESTSWDGGTNFSYSNSGKVSTVIKVGQNDLGTTQKDMNWDILLGASDDTTAIQGDKHTSCTFGSPAYDLSVKEGVLKIEAGSKLKLDYDEVIVEAGATLILDGDITISGDLRNTGGTIAASGGTLTFQSNGNQTLAVRNGDRFNNMVVDLPSNRDLNVGNKDLYIDGDLTVSGGNINDANAFIQGNLTFGLNAGPNWDVDINLTGPDDATMMILGDSSKIYPDVQLNKDRVDAVVTLGSPWHMSHPRPDLELTKGILRTSAKNKMILGPGSDFDAGTAGNGWVEGPIQVWGRRTQTYHLGAKGKYAPVSLSRTDNDNDCFEVEYVYDDPATRGYDRSSKDGSIDHVSNKEFWNITRCNGNTAVYVTLGWDQSRSADQPSFADHKVLHWDGTKWEDLGGANRTGTINGGTVRSQNKVNNFSPFTLPGDGGTVLSKDEYSASATVMGSNVSVNCQVKIEEEHSEYIVERSVNARKFEEVGRLEPSSKSGEYFEFAIEDRNPYSGTSYYRLKIMKDDGNYTYTKMMVVDIAVTFDDTEVKLDGFKLYPKPSSGIINIQLEDPEGVINQVAVYDMAGREWAAPISFNSEGTYIDLSLVPNGYYMVHISSSTGNQVDRVLIQK